MREVCIQICLHVAYSVFLARPTSSMELCLLTENPCSGCELLPLIRTVSQIGV
jgi:hypothetical protein